MFSLSFVLIYLWLFMWFLTATLEGKSVIITQVLDPLTYLPIEQFRLELCGKEPDSSFLRSKLPNYEKRKYLKFVDLRCVHFEPKVVETFLSHCPVLEVLIFYNVSWEGELLPSRVKLPKLRIFNFNFLFESLKNESLSDLKSPNYREGIEKYIFFYKSSPDVILDSPNWDDMLVINVTTESTIEKFHFSIDFMKKSVFIESIASQRLTQHLGLSSFEFVDNIVDICHIPNTTQNLQLEGKFELINGGLVDLLLNLKSAKKLRIDPNSGEDFTLDVATLPIETLEEGYFSRVHFTVSTSKVVGPLVLINLKTLTLRSCIMDFTLFDFSYPLTSLTLQNVVIKKGNFSKIFTSAGSLRRLELKLISHIEYENDNEVYLSYFPLTSLEILKLENLNIEMNHFVQFERLVQLNLTKCTISDKIYEDFENVFRTVNHLSLIETGDVELVNKILKSSTNSNLTRMTFTFNITPENRTGPYQDVLSILNSSGFFNKSFQPYYEDQNGTVEVNLGRNSDGTWSYGFESTEKRIKKETNHRKIEFHRILLKFLYIVLLTLCVSGTVTNALSGLVLSRKPMRGKSGTYMLLCRTFSDLILLVTYIVPLLMLLDILYIKPVNDNFQSSYVYFYNYIAYPLNKTAYTATVYITLLINIERFVVVCYPFQIKLFMTIRKSIIWIIFIIFIAITLNSPRWLEPYKFVTVYENDAWYLVSSDDNNRYYCGWLWVSVMYVLPVSSMMVLSLTIWKQIKLANQNGEIMNQSLSAEAKDLRREEMSLTRMLIWIVLVFFICNVCHIFLFGIFFFVSNFKDVVNIEILTCAPIIINSIINFIVYCTLGNKLLSEMVKILPACLTTRCGRRRSENINLNNLTATMDVPM